MRSVLSTALVCFALLNPVTSTAHGCDPSKPGLFKSLILNCQEEYAKFLYKFIPELADEPDTLIFAPVNDAVKEYLKFNPQPDPPGYDDSWITSLIDSVKHKKKIFSRGPNTNGGPAGRGNSGTGGRPSRTARGTTVNGGGTNAKTYRSPGGGGRKIRRRDGGNVAILTSGGGAVANVLQEPQAYSCGFLITIDRYFLLRSGLKHACLRRAHFLISWTFFLSFTSEAQCFEKTLQDDPLLGHLLEILKKIPDTKAKLFGSSRYTFLLPTLESMIAAGLDPKTCSIDKLQKFVDDHSILNSDFIGYIPEYQDGKCYTVSSGRSFTAKFIGPIGGQTSLNGAEITKEDIITDKGVIQLIEKVCHYNRRKNSNN